MRSARRAWAFVSGLLLYITAIWISGRLADLRLPREFYTALGGRYSVTTVLVESLVIALLMFGLALGWSRLTVRQPPPGRRPVTGWCLGGIATAWFGCAIYGTIHMALSWDLHDLPVGLWLLSSDMPPLWGVLNTLAVVGGVLLARRQMVPRARGQTPTSSS